MFKTKKAFTLVELMLTLSIIGVLMAILLPMLSNTKPDDRILKYRKVFFAVEKAVKHIANNDKLYEEKQIVYGTGETLNGVEVKGVYTGTDLGRPVNTTNGSNQVLCENLARALNTIGEVKCETTNYKLNTNTGANITAASQVNFTLPGGAVIAGFDSPWVTSQDDGAKVNYTNEYYITLCVDVNGLSEKPNAGCETTSRAVKKRDQYRIRISRSGKVYTGSSTGKNNFYLENLILEDPRALSHEKKTFTSAEETALKTAGTLGSYTAIDPETELTNYNNSLTSTTGDSGDFVLAPGDSGASPQN